MIKIKGKEYPETENEFNEWNNNHIQLLRKIVIDFVKFFNDISIKSINYYGNSIVILELNSSYPDNIDVDKHFNDYIHTMYSEGTGCVVVYRVSPTKLALVSDEEYKINENNDDDLLSKYIKSRMADAKTEAKSGDFQYICDLRKSLTHVWLDHRRNKSIEQELMELQTLIYQLENGTFKD